jgi:hypothetical protein
LILALLALWLFSFRGTPRLNGNNHSVSSGWCWLISVQPRLTSTLEVWEEEVNVSPILFTQNKRYS